jgi:hypothetical protein
MIDVQPIVLEGGGIRLEPLGAKRDGVIRHHGMRRDGTVRDTVMCSILAAERRDVRRHLELRRARHRG